MRITKWMTIPLLTIGLGVTGSLALGADEQNPINTVRGGQMYDNWWKAANLPEPTGDHPLYPAIGQKTGSATWRCKECHGWDYKGVDGAYGSGSHFTGIPGVFGSTLTAQEMFDLIKNDTGTFGHGYGNAGLSDADIEDIVDFLQTGLVDTDLYIDGAGAFIGDADAGRWGYKAAGNYYNCQSCHGADGTMINFGTETSPEYVSDVANDNPWELLHKIRFGQPASLMPSWLLTVGDVQGAADVGAFVQSDYPVAHYVGDLACIACHQNSPTPDFFDAYMNSGHPWKLHRTGGQVPAVDEWPHTPVPPLPVVHGTQLQWSDVEYVIGNYNWKARFVDHDGFIYTGDAGESTQWNLATQEWVPYHAGEIRPYNCGRCHTTGYSPDGNQQGLPGLIGTWTEEGIRCEACHGPSGDHVAFPDDLRMRPEGGKDCSDCHYRDASFRMPWSGGFTRHHQQGEDFSHSPHANKLSCETCHDPHRSTVNADNGTIAMCTDCHPGSEANSFYVVDNMEDVDCIDCHMPYMGKSAVAVNQFKGDIRAHLFRITRAPIFAVDNTYDDNGTTFWNQESNGSAFLTLDYACMGCHIEEGENVSMQELSNYAVRIHTDHRAALPLEVPCTADMNSDGTLDFFDVQAFLAAFSAGDQVADFNGDSTFDFFDVQAFLQAFSEGCP